MNWLGELVQKYVTLDDSVLDVGCGIHNTLDGLLCRYYLGCDIWIKYLDQFKDRRNTIVLDATKDLWRFPDKSYDVVLCLDVLEHVTIEQAEQILGHLTRICRKYAIIFTPSKFETNESAAKNAWDLGECEHQYHKCVLNKDVLTNHGFKVKTDNADDAFFGVYHGNCV